MLFRSEIFRPFQTEFVQGLTFYRKAPSEPFPALPAGAPEIRLPEIAPLPRPLPPVAGRPPSPPVPAPSGDLREVRLLADRGRWDEAAAKCRALLDSQGLNPAAHFTMGLILEHTGPSSAAERSLRAAVYLDRSFALAHYHLALLLHKRRAVKDARRAFQNVLDLLEGAADETLAEGDGITAAELRAMAAAHLALLEKP